ncbi:MAG: hypothetical protein KAS53_00605 [Candidatus Cloacimonetes bacterium]|nr:hypothetical protein [Candidatus Cloacimonadota bacterium]
MQKDMHFYGVYCLCRAAGINEETANIIAYSSQFVDDALGDGTIIFKKEKSAILPTMTSHKPLDLKNAFEEDQWRVWVAFHFLPGDNKDAKNFTKRMICEKNSKTADAILEHALVHKKKNIGPYLCGITAHVFADTFAHYGFIGKSTSLNRVKDNSIHTFEKNSSTKIRNQKRKVGFIKRLMSSLAETIPMGHGAVATFPDKPYLKWEYKYEKGRRKKVERTNSEDFLEACEQLHRYFKQFVMNNPGKGDIQKAVEWNSISAEIKSILEQEGEKKLRIKKWKEAISYNMLFNASDKDKKIGYDERTWKITKQEKKNLRKAEIEKTHHYLFYEAARKHRNYVLRSLLPKHGLILA